MVDVVDLFNTCLFIQDNLDADLSLMFLAQTVGLSRFRFHRVFKAWRGETLHDFVTRMRMEKAAFELSYPLPRSNRRSVKAIAFASGYKSLSSFSHAFSSYAHVSPRQFRYRMLHERASGSRSVHLAALAGARPSVHQGDSVFAPFRISVREEVARPLVVIGSSVPGYRRAAVQGVPRLPIFGIESLSGLFARLQHRHGVGARSAPLTCLGIAPEHWERAIAQGAIDRTATKRSTLVLKGGRYAVLEGCSSVAQLYRVWRREFDQWLSDNAECPRPEQLFVEFHDGLPNSPHEVVQLTLYIPLEAHSARAVRRRAPV